MTPPYRSLKDRLYYVFVEKNSLISNEYISYVNARLEEHQSQRWRHWLVLIRLNWHYRIRRATTPLLIKNTGTAAKAKAPYMDGPESTKGNRQDPYHFAAGLMKYDVISFDIFDTLILRSLNNPADLFAFIGEELGVYDFADLRKKSENEVRKIKAAERKSNEITLEEIYERVEYYSGIDSQKGQNVELKKEKSVCFANPYMYEVFQILKFSNKAIYAVSDMYLTKKQMKILLEKCGYTGFADVIVSCDYYCNKASGGLFKILKNKVGGDRSIIHIGDNWKADINGAKKEEIDTRYYRACRELGNEHRAPGMSPLIKAAYDGIINTTIHNGFKQYSYPWEYGFCYGGLVTLGYTNWIYRQAQKDNISKILFVARDGYTIKKIYDGLKFDISNEYIFWSRLASLSCVTDNDRYYFLRRSILEFDNGTITIKQYLELMGLSDLAELCEQSRIPVDMLLEESSKILLWDFLVKNWEKVISILQDCRVGMISYVKKIVGTASSVAIVDIGWTSQNLIPLYKILQKELNIKTVIYMLGCRNTIQNPVEQLIGKIKVYMFSSNYNRMIYDCVRKEKTNLPLESFFMAPHCSFEKIDQNQSFLFADPEIGNYELLNEMIQGIQEFCEKYIELCNQFPPLLNISGYDSFIPLKLLLDNKNYLSFSMSKLSTNMKLSKNSDDKQETFETLFRNLK